MERDRRLAWLRSAYLVFGVIVVTVLGGVVQLLDVAEYLNYGLVRILEPNPAGPELHGHYLFPTNWLTLFVLFVVLMLIFPAMTLLRVFSEDGAPVTDPDTSLETIGMRQDLDDAMRYARNITYYMYPSEERILPRFNIEKVWIRYLIKANGDTDTEVVFDIKCVNDPAHFFSYWIRSDPESGEVKFLRQLNFQAFDVESGQKLDWLPTQNDPQTKAMAIFFPEVMPGTRKKLRFTFTWPRFMGKLIELGSCNFDWFYLTREREIPASFRAEWIFDNSFNPLHCRIAGQAAETAKLWCENHGSTFAWIYEDPKAKLASRCVVEFASAQAQT